MFLQQHCSGWTVWLQREREMGPAAPLAPHSAMHATVLQGCAAELAHDHSATAWIKTTQGYHIPHKLIKPKMQSKIMERSVRAWQCDGGEEGIIIVRTRKRTRIVECALLPTSAMGRRKEEVASVSFCCPRANVSVQWLAISFPCSGFMLRCDPILQRERLIL
jgi:hypothetical protein